MQKTNRDRKSIQRPSSPTCKRQPLGTAGARKEPPHPGKRGHFHPQGAMRPQRKSSRGFHPRPHSPRSASGERALRGQSGSGSLPAPPFPGRPGCSGGRGRGWGRREAAPGAPGETESRPGPAVRRWRLQSSPAANISPKTQLPPHNFGLTSLLHGHPLRPSARTPSPTRRIRGSRPPLLSRVRGAEPHLVQRAARGRPRRAGSAAPPAPPGTFLT